MAMDLFARGFKNTLSYFKKVDISKQHRLSSTGSGHECLKKSVCGEKTAAVLIGLYKDHGGNLKLTKTGRLLDQQLVGGAGTLIHHLQIMKPWPDVGQVRVFNGLHSQYNMIAVAGLGDECQGFNIREQFDEKKEIIRVATASGVRAFHGIDVEKIFVEDFGHAESAAEGSSLAAWAYQEFKEVTKRKQIPRVYLFDSCDFTGWQIGLHKAAAQNLARHLQEAPSNHLTPQTFAQTAIELLTKYNINVEVRMKKWAQLRNLNASLAVGKAGCDPIFLEIFYEGCDPDICPIVLIGKGVTFNTGGLCLKKSHDMKHMRGDMAGAATVLATMRAIAALQLPINVRGLIPLCSNQTGATSYRPGDTYRAYNGKTILVENTGCEGLLMLADALSYAGEYKPKFIVDIGTMTQDAIATFGQGASLVFTNNESLYEMIRIASIHTGDRVWKLPLWYYFRDYMIPHTSDLSNKVPLLAGGGPCKAAAFLREFVPKGIDWMHIDIQNVYKTKGDDAPYLSPGMTGRPTRNLIEFLAQLACSRSCK